MKPMTSQTVLTGKSARAAGLSAALMLAISLSPSGASAVVSVLDSPHNLSASGGKGKHGIAFVEEQRVCIFCHAPHNANSSGPLWGRDLSSAAGYKPYDSSTLKASPKPDKPTGGSRLCLSCHDGTIALGQFVGSKITTLTLMPYDSNPANNSNLTTDLSSSHPISFGYTDALAASQGELAYPETLPPQVKLENGVVLQCTSCHDPHNYQYKNFLVIDNTASGSPLCTACHKNAGWPNASHNPAVNPSVGPACMNCHYAHSAPQPVRLLQYVREEDNCTLTCHNSGGAPLQNVKSLFDASMYRHPVDLTTGVHDESEQLPATSYHVECVDCHNPHAANGSNVPLAFAPSVNGPLTGVRKDSSGGIATKEYEICFKCHSGGSAYKFAGVTETPPNRVIQEADQSKRFDVNNPSFHPVMAQSRMANSSLLTNLQSTMVRIYCSDCHNSDQSVTAGGSGANGPHGSRFEHILMARYDMPTVTAVRPTYSPTLYDLCYRCHQEAFIMGSNSGFNNAGVNEHSKHVRDRGLPCYVCHDPHGVSSQSLTPATVQNNSHLINFNRDYTVSAAVPSPFYQALLPASGNCTVSCHTGGNHSYAR